MGWLRLGLSRPARDDAGFRPPNWAPVADARVTIAKVILPCNWAQILEGAIDSAHSSSLHSSDMVPARVDGAKATDSLWLRPSTDKAPRLQVERTGYGFRYAAIRRPHRQRERERLCAADGVRGASDRTDSAQQPLQRGEHQCADGRHQYRVLLHRLGGTPSRRLIPPPGGNSCGRRSGRSRQYYRPLRNVDNRFWQDRAAMKAGNFTGITGFPNQDVAMWLTMGPIAERWRERLGASDLAIVEFRKQMVDAVRAFARGEPAIGTGDAAIPAEVCSFQAIIPKTTDWREFSAQYVGTRQCRRWSRRIPHKPHRPESPGFKAESNACQNYASLSPAGTTTARAPCSMARCGPMASISTICACRSKRRFSAWRDIVNSTSPR